MFPNTLPNKENWCNLFQTRQVALELLQSFPLLELESET